MNLIILQENSLSKTNKDRCSEGLLRFAFSNRPLSDVVINGLGRYWAPNDQKKEAVEYSRKIQPGVVFAIPQDWTVESDILANRQSKRSHSSEPLLIPYSGGVSIGPELMSRAGQEQTMGSWFVVSNGRYALKSNYTLLRKILDNIAADVVAVNLSPELLSEREKVRLTDKGAVAGLSRLYSDSAELALIPGGWPHYLFVRTAILEKTLVDGSMSLSFPALMKRCRSNGLTVKAVNVAGKALDLETESGLLRFCRTELTDTHGPSRRKQNTKTDFSDTKFVGQVFVGKNVHIEPGVVVVGPSVIGDDVVVKEGAVIHSSIIGPGISIPRNQLVQDCVVAEQQQDYKQPGCAKGKKSSYIYDRYSGHFLDISSPFRIWPRFSYVGCFKRIVDCTVAIMVLALFLPLMPFIALAIKLNSPGPVFYGDKRQGLHGRNFRCLKFRTMITGAAKIQEKLRVVSQVDGPQFKMTDDPRISTVGRFLRETYIDEIPQFFNVLLGQMSVVGPRPSPESENTLCPFWRDARLSVRPGVTGMWQVNRTRQAMKDFQEWIYYDTEYVRSLSLKTDLLICFQTTRKMIGSFINQF